MNVDRRSLLKGMALGGLASVALGGSGLALARSALGGAPSRPTLVLVSPAVAGSAFLEGIHASPAAGQATLVRSGLGLDFVLDLQQRLESKQPQRIIGLADDASAALILDLARSAGARVQWLGQHRADAGASAHHLLTAEAAHGCALQLGLQLDACGAGFDLRQQRPLGSPQTLRLGAAPRAAVAAEQWAATLGYGLATLGQDNPGRAPLITGRSSPLTGNFVSFSIEA